jgi:hypothetical protein
VDRRLDGPQNRSGRGGNEKRYILHPRGPNPDPAGRSIVTILTEMPMMMMITTTTTTTIIIIIIIILQGIGHSQPVPVQNFNF